MKTLEILEKYEEFLHTHTFNVISDTINGAGPSKYGFWVRDTLFYKYCVTDAANVHDFLYSQYGPKSITRKQADGVFLELMLKKLNTQTKVSKVLNKPLVYMYYLSVRALGWMFWSEKS